MNVAIYSRKSVYSDKSDSTDAQYNMSVEYIKSHYNSYNIFRYEDEGFTGANTNRPGYNDLICDTKEKKIDVVICYKIDRISRDVRDFSNFFNLLSECGVTFVSIKEQIDTSTPLGRAMMYICSVFAQMERETIAERVKDNMIELAKSGKWAGGKAPLGFNRQRIEIKGKNHTILVENPAEIPFLNMVADTFLQGYSLNGLERHFRENGTKTLQGCYLSSNQIYTILKNPHYCTADTAAYDYFKNLGCIMASEREEFDGKHGVIAYGRTSGGRGKKHRVNPPEKWIICIGLHKPLFSSEKWINIQNRFGLNTINKTRKHHVGILKGIVKCSCGYVMRVQHKVDKTYHKTYDNYFCQQRNRRGIEYCDRKYTAVEDMDSSIIEILKQISLDKNMIDNYVIKDTTLTVASRNKADIQKDIDALTRKIENLTAAIANNSDSAAANYLMLEIEKLDGRIAGLNFEIREANILTQKKIDFKADKEKKYKAVCDIVNSLETATYEEINTMLKSLLVECTYDGERLKIKI